MASTDARPVPQKNVAYRVYLPIFDNTGALVTGAAGLDSEVSKDGAAFADCTNEATEIGSSGTYYLDLTSTEMNADAVVVIVKTSTTDAKTTPIFLYPEEAGDIRVNVTQVNGTTQTAGDLAALATTIDDFLDTEIAAIKAKTDQLTFGTANRVDAQVYGMEADVVTAAAVATGAIDADALATDAVTEIWAGSTAPEAATIAGAVWDEDATAHQTQGTFGQAIGDPVADTNSIFKAVVTDATGATVGVDAAAILDDTGTSGVVLANDAITAAKIAADAIDASALAADAVTEIQSGLATAASLSTVAGYIDTEVASILAAVDTEVAAIKTVTDAIGATGTGLTAIPWNASWDAEVQSEVQDAIEVNNLDHLVKSAVDTDFATTVHLDSVIGQLADNGTTATFDRTTDSLEALQGAVDTIDNFLDTEVADILADTNELQTDLANGGRLDLLIDAIKAKTDNLPTDPADQSAVEAAITAATSPLATAANLATVAGYLDTEIAAILADTNELQTDWANGGRLDLLIDAIKAKTDSLTFTVAGQVDSNIQYVNDVQIDGDGQSGTEWGPV